MSVTGTTLCTLQDAAEARVAAFVTLSLDERLAIVKLLASTLATGSEGIGERTAALCDLAAAVHALCTLLEREYRRDYEGKN